ncbi:MAG: 1-(5-phosphoribosyl)-5-[(5-phosphoribosylamino)methylideneamino]imidazole-4-carboxamide isomerase [Halofilum sp. (in: g-proteobacteria)]|nr:1-(5-phosphoribosyl)-5-[(5-phosphoribosylamino)methylideneamino]imidazole-4-carboxamide isomerase [Halofilum sp. (in: g-proteobacteria)]
MLMIPAIDLKQGRCVRLRQGRMEDDTVFSDDPVAMAGRWHDAGARRLHLVDLDGAFAGEPRHAEVIANIARAYPDLPLEVGGGIRNHDTIATYLEAGVSWAIIGTQAVRDPDFVAAACERFPGHVIVGLDARDGHVAVEGWAEESDHDAVEFARGFADAGVAGIIYTDIGRDGMLQGPNVEATVRVARAAHVPVYASGGMRSLEDVRALAAAGEPNLAGAILGRSIYEGTIDLTEAQRLADDLSEGTANERE